MKLDELQHVLRASAAISKESSFVGPETAVMPGDWMSRAGLHYIGDITAICPDLHDLVRELLKHGLVSAATLAERIGMLDAAKYPLAHLVAWVERRKLESEGTAP